MESSVISDDVHKHKVHGQLLPPIVKEQSFEVGEYKWPIGIAHAQIGLFPQISKWRRAFVKEEYLRGQITQLNLVQMIADIRDHWVKTATQLFPRLKDVLGE